MSERVDSLASRLRAPALALGAGLAATTLLLLVFAPRFWAWPAIDIPDLHHYPEVNRAADALRQVGDPFAEIANPSNRVIEWRLLVPLLVTLLGLGREGLLLSGMLGCPLVLAAVFGLTRRETGRAGLAAAATLVCGSASWFFVSTGWLSYGDSWLVLGALGLVFARGPALLAASCLLTPWIDERFLLALPLLLLARWLPAAGFDAARRREALTVAATVAPYLLLRAGAALLAEGDASASHLSDQLASLRELPEEGRRRMAAGAWQSLRGAWIFVGLWLAEPWRRGDRRRGLLVAGAFAATALVNLLIANDCSRSQSALIPLALLGLAAAARSRPREAWTAVLLALPLALLTPARHVVTLFEIPVRPLHVERERAAEPPAELDPRARAWRALAREEAGDLAGALKDLDAAVVLDSGSPSPRLLRGQVLERAGRLGEAREAFRRARALAGAGSPEAETAAEALRRLGAAD